MALKDLFRVGLNEYIHFLPPGGTIHWSLEKYIDHALLLAGSPLSVGVADEEPCNCAVPAPEHFHVPTFMSGVVLACQLLQNQFTSCLSSQSLLTSCLLRQSLLTS